ncbi:C2 domain - like 10 [Theobroma cacao]|nr:C2 domain - like 10 [Theobroma cacao]
MNENVDSGSYNYKMFNFFNRKFKINEVEPPADVKKAFAEFTDGGAAAALNMTAEQLKRFLVVHQGEVDRTLEDAERIIQQVVSRRHHVTKYASHSLNLDDFFHFLFFDDLNGPIKTQVHHDMTAPLSHYFIYTGHNSYLTGNQLSSDCSEVPIIKALQRGVRVIELDLWPSSSKDEVLVLHGRTLTSPVSLIKCLISIKEYAFATSPYPVIITLEDHLTPELQAKVAEMVIQTFGTMLYYPESDCLSEFPSPESLKHRIIISTKPPKEYLESRSKDNSSPGEMGFSEEESSSKEMQDNKPESEADDRSDSDHDDEDFNECTGKSGQTGVSAYKRLITIHAGKPKGALKDALKVAANKVRRLSMSEQELEKAAASHGSDVVSFTQKNILRIYPKGTRFTSSNYKPTIGWMHGAQMIAFNMQGYGKSLWLMHGMFRANGGCGYVRKPDFLMQKGSHDVVLDPKITLPVQKKLKVKIYMGDGWRLDFSHTHFDTYSPPDFYTKVYIVGVPADEAKRKTRIIGDDWSPVWDEEFTYPLTVPDLALLRIEVREYDMSEKDDFGGQTCLPVSDLRPGIRSVSYFNQQFAVIYPPNLQQVYFTISPITFNDCEKKAETCHSDFWAGHRDDKIKMTNAESNRHNYSIAICQLGSTSIDIWGFLEKPMSKQTYRVCFCFRRRFRLTVSEAPEGIKKLFEQYSENGIMSLDGLRRFLVEVQKEEKATIEDAQKIIDSVKHFHRKGLNLEAFFKYLFGDINPPLASLGVHHDMSAPLSHYFIYTGHNSYLTGNQLSSDCSDVPIINALKRGVRVIELDIWPNSAKDNVDVLHGRTLTTPVELIQCLKSIREHAFVASEYPVVITLEDHLAPDLQAKVAEMVTQTFGDVLFSPGPECLKEFPSPESLKKRIIISTKPPKEYLEAKEAKDKENDAEKGKAASDEEAWGKEVPDLKGSHVADDKNDLDEEDEEDPEDGDKSQHNLAPEYKRLIAIHAGKPKGGLDEWLRVDPDKVRRLSMSEQELEKAALTHGKQIVRFTQRNILRVYPKGIRVDSSNYNPLIGWMHGAQMVAFNMQGYGRSLWLMHGMFKANGGCGYVKKPDFLLKSGPQDDVFDPSVRLPVKTVLKVTVYMGEGWYHDFHHTHFDAYSPPDFYARVGIAGVPADNVMKKTKTLEDNWVPSWNEEFEFPLTVPELALLRIEVHEYDMSEKDDFGGQTCLPVSELRSGIRAVPLNSRKGDKYNSVKLLMRFELSDIRV